MALLDNSITFLGEDNSLVQSWPFRPHNHLKHSMYTGTLGHTYTTLWQTLRLWHTACQRFIQSSTAHGFSLTLPARPALVPGSDRCSATSACLKPHMSRKLVSAQAQPKRAHVRRFDAFLSPAPMQDKKIVRLAASGRTLKVTPKKALRWRSVRTACGVSGPRRTSLSSSGPIAQNSSANPWQSKAGQKGGKSAAEELLHGACSRGSPTY